MNAMTIHQPPIVDADGNINVHGRSGISLSVKRYTDATLTTEIDISTDVLTFEVDNADPVTLIADPNDPLGRLLVITDLKEAGLDVTPGAYPPFVLLDASGQVDLVRWEGLLVIRGWED